MLTPKLYRGNRVISVATSFSSCGYPNGPMLGRKPLNVAPALSIRLSTSAVSATTCSKSVDFRVAYG